MGTTFTETVLETFHVVSCYSCSLRFAIPQQLYTRVVTDAQDSIYCPACGKLTCWRESEDKKKIKALEQKLIWEANEVARQKREVERQRAARESAENSLRATHGVITKMKKRAVAGVCPCCNRTFKQLAAHMAAKHPDFVSK